MSSCTHGCYQGRANLQQECSSRIFRSGCYANAGTCCEFKYLSIVAFKPLINACDRVGLSLVCNLRNDCPPFHSCVDKDGIALIICETELEQKYRDLVQGKTILESTLHTNLAEHLNSEIGLGTIRSISTAKAWLRGSFLFQRLQKNPNHYSLGKDDNQSWEERVDELLLQSIEKLRQTQLVENGPRGDELISTDFGDIMSKARLSL